MGRVLVKPEVCIGCHLCEIWCAVAHSRSRNIFKAFFHEQPKPLPRMLVEERLPLTFAFSCRHCAEPDCVFACISGALTKDQETGRVLHDQTRCVGCYSCVMACPYGCVLINEKENRVVKCDLCTGLDYPYCVRHCPNGALIYQEAEGVQG